MKSFKKGWMTLINNFKSKTFKRSLARRGFAIFLLWVNGIILTIYGMLKFQTFDALYLIIAIILTPIAWLISSYLDKTLTKSEEMEEMINHIESIIYSKEPETNKLQVSSSIKDLTDYKPEEFQLDPMLWRTLILEEDFHSIQEIDEEIKKGNPFNRTYRIKRKDGKISWVEHRAYPIFNEQKKLIKIIGSIVDISKYKEMEQQIKKLAMYDHLTGLFNRSSLLEKLTNDSQHAFDYKHSLAVLFIGLDNFKNINDTHGHYFGDFILNEMANRLKFGLTSTSDIFRFEGDKFVIVMPNGSEIEAIKEAKKIMKVCSEPIELGNEVIKSSASIGIALYPVHGRLSEELISLAEQAMYVVKVNGKGHYHVSKPDDGKENEKNITIDKNLTSALENNELSLEYQPRVNLKTSQIEGVEAVIRWNLNKTGNLPPELFISIAEQNGLVHKIGQWMVSQICMQLHFWLEKGYRIPISINISELHLKSSTFIKYTKKILQEKAIPPELLEFEISEKMLKDLPTMQQNMKELKKLGIRLSIDHFGSGMSSFYQIDELPIDIIKIDRDLFKHDASLKERRHFLKTILDIGKAEGIQVVAEGIEHKDQYHILEREGCDLFQGSFFSPPLKAIDVEKLYKESSTQWGV